MAKTRSIFLYPFSLIFGFIAGLRNFLFNAGILRSYEFNLPVICVGNIAAGGTGKTPHAEYLISILKNNFRVALLSRGYKRKSKGFIIAGKNATISEIGDEPLQISRKFPEITVAVDRDRVHGVNEILRLMPDTSVILLDDGFQHRRLRPGLSILLTDYNNLIIHDHLLPYGNLRESRHNMHRADVILITKSPEGISPIQRRLIVREMNKKPYQNLYFTSLTYGEPLPVFEEQTKGKPFKEGVPAIVLVTGIANPEPLKEYLSNKAGEIIHLGFGDHHNFGIADIEKIMKAFNDLKAPDKYIITTEKDSVRLREFTNIAEPFRSAFYYIPFGIWFLNDDKEEFDNLIIDYVRKNKRNNRIS